LCNIKKYNKNASVAIKINLTNQPKKKHYILFLTAAKQQNITALLQ